MLSTKKPEVIEGQTLFYVDSNLRHTREVIVTEVGRKYFYTCNKCKWLKETWEEVTDYSKGTLYSSRAEYETKVALRNGYRDLIIKLRDNQYKNETVPLTIEQIEQINKWIDEGLKK